MTSGILVEIIFRGFSMIIFFIFIITMLQYLIQTTKIHKPLFICVISFWIFGIAGDSVEIARQIYQMQNNLISPDAMYKSYGLISKALFNISISCFYLFILLQLYFSFRGSYYPLSKLSIILHTINLVIILFLFAVFLITSAFFTFNTTPLNLMLVFMVLGIIHFVYSFNKRLFQLIIATSKVDNECSSINSRIRSMSQSTPQSPKNQTPNKTEKKQQKRRFNESQRKLLKAAAKHTVLLSLVVCTMLSLFLAGAILMKAGIVEEGELIPVSWQIIYIFGKDCIGLFIWLGFANNERIYQCILHVVDNCCLILCKKIVSCRIVKDEKELAKTMQQTETENETENETHNHQTIAVSQSPPPPIGEVVIQ
eukprot:42301_1